MELVPRHHPGTLGDRFGAHRTARAEPQTERKDLQQGHHADAQNRQRDQNLKQGEAARPLVNARAHDGLPGATAIR